jgi:hypothetical protein
MLDFVKKQAFTASVARIAEETGMLWSHLHCAKTTADVQAATIRVLEEEMRKRDAVLAENTRRINALMEFAGVKELEIPASPIRHVYVQERQ